MCRENFAKELVPNRPRPVNQAIPDAAMRNRQANAERERPAENIQRFLGYPHQARVLPRPNNVRRETVFSRTMTYFEQQNEQIALQQHGHSPRNRLF